MTACRLINLGRSGYDSVLDLQLELVSRKIEGAEDDYLILAEHEPVVTLGAKGSERDLRLDGSIMRKEGIVLRKVSRGGAATYHGPGQLVGYPIMDLRRQGSDIHDYLRRLESCIIAALRALGVGGRRIPGRTGVWVGRVPAEKKIASIGVAVRHWITYHGFALNVGCNISGFEAIVPCGMSDCRMTSVSLEVGRDVSMEEAADCVAPAFAREFGCELREGDASERREFAQGRAG